jgi:hypothetical protein
VIARNYFVSSLSRGIAFRAHNQSQIIQVKTKKQQVKLLLFCFEISSWRSFATSANNGYNSPLPPTPGAGGSKYDIAGTFYLWHLTHKKVNVTLVSANGAAIPNNA